MKHPTADELLRLLMEVDFLKGVDADTLQVLAEETELQILEKGQFLFKKGDEGDALFLVLSGFLELQIVAQDGSLAVSTVVGPRECVGEMAILFDAPRSCSVRAKEEALLAKLTRQQLSDLLISSPDISSNLRRLTLDRIPLLRATGLSILHGLEDQNLRDLQSEMEWFHLSGGEYLFRRGDQGECLYIICSGRVQVVLENELVAQLGRGEMVGEMALLSEEPRSASVRAVRDTELVRISRTGFQKLLQRNPETAAHVMRTLVERIRRVTAQPRPETRLTTLALLPLAENVTHSAKRLVDAIALASDVSLVDSTTVQERFKTSVNDRNWEWNNPKGIKILDWLSHLETTSEYVIYVCDLEPNPWTECCLRQADEVVLIASDDSDPKITASERSLLESKVLNSERRTHFVMLHEGSVVEPTDTESWLAHRQVSDWHHLRKDSTEDFDRLARILTDKATGIVLSGGGAKGFAHIGVLKALSEAGIPVDYIGGTSMGAVVGAGYAMGMGFDELQEVARQEFVDKRPTKAYTLPLVSVISGNRIDAGLKQKFGSYQIEDLWLKFFCVSCNLTQARIEVHQKGPLWAAVRASIALPGILPPQFDGGNILVDGGVLNNLPVDVMKDLWGGKVIAVDVGDQEILKVDSQLRTCPTALQLLFSGRRTEFPSISSILMNSLLCSSEQQRTKAVQQADYVLRPPLEKYSLLGFEKIDELIQIGYQYARDRTEEIKKLLSS